jgi:quercetin dioxygenase-like cupin family protein
LHYVGHLDWSFSEEPATDTATASGLRGRVLVGPGQGSAHTELAVGSLGLGGWLARHVHSFEEALWVLEGELILELERSVHRLQPGDFALIPIGTHHTLAAGETAVRWWSVNTPPRRPPDAPVPDTIFAAQRPDIEALWAIAERPRFGDPSVRHVGHYLGTPPQAEALRLDEPARSRDPAGYDTALLAYSGISVKMLVDRVLGAELMTVFTVDYEVGGGAQVHDHPFEETYFFLAGEVDAELDGQAYRLGPGDVVFTAVGGTHGFWNAGQERVRWIETQAPQPPGRHAYRWDSTWKKVAARGIEPWPASIDGR